MYKTILAASAVLLTTTPALAGPSLNTEVRFADVREAHQDSTEYKLEFKDVALGSLNYGFEVVTKQNDGIGSLNTRLSGKIGTTWNNVSVYSELGESLNGGNNNFTFWGVGANTSVPVRKNVSVILGYRHREGFDTINMNQERVNSGVSVVLNSDYSVAAQYYRTRGSSNTDAIGLGITRKF
jgi:hypothetical protein